MKSAYNINTLEFVGNFPDNLLPDGCAFATVNYYLQFITGKWNGSEWIEGANEIDIDFSNEKDFTEKGDNTYDCLTIKFLQIAMNKPNITNIVRLINIKEDYERLYKAVTEEEPNQTILDATYAEMQDEWPEDLLDSTLLSYGVLQADLLLMTRFDKMKRLIIIKFTYGNNLYKKYEGYKRRFVVKWRFLIDTKQWGKLNTVYNDINSFPENVQDSEIDTYFLTFDSI